MVHLILGARGRRYPHAIALGALGRRRDPLASGWFWIVFLAYSTVSSLLAASVALLDQLPQFQAAALGDAKHRSILAH